MTDAVIISEYTYRSLNGQLACLSRSPDTVYYKLPDDLGVIFRPTRRSKGRVFTVMSFGILAETEKNIREFGAACKKEKVDISSYEDEFTWTHNSQIALLVGMWRSARVKGAAKIGARISADNKKAKAAEGITKIKARWPLPSKEWSTADLLKEADVSFNTAKAHLGSRPIAQYNYQAAQKRKERKNGKL